MLGAIPLQQIVERARSTSTRSHGRGQPVQANGSELPLQNGNLDIDAGRGLLFKGGSLGKEDCTAEHNGRNRKEDDIEGGKTETRRSENFRQWAHGGYSRTPVRCGSAPVPGRHGTACREAG